MKLSKRKSIEYCMEMWDILARTGGDWKDEAYDELRIERCELPRSVYSHCFACEYRENHKGDYCDERCILADIWGVAGCEEYGSPYWGWHTSLSSQKRRKYAKEIADGCRKLLKKMDKK